MVFAKEQNVVRRTGLTSVGPGKMTGTDVTHEPTSMDLSTKLHYLRGVYFFRSDAVRDLSMKKLKEAMFYWLNEYYMTCGRFRRSESSRPYIKCNDSGARFIEAQCEMTMEEWLELKDWSAQSLLFSQQVIGPEIAFSPPILFQHTAFKCGGISLGLSWAHVLGDIYSASEFMNSLTSFISGTRPTKSPTQTAKPIDKSGNHKNPPTMENDPLSLKRVDPVGDHWMPVNSCKMETFSFCLCPAQIRTLSAETDQVPLFESVCALLWHSIATVRNGSEPKTVTICKRSPHRRTNAVVGNNQTIISTVEADFSISNQDPQKLAKFLASKALDETTQIENVSEEDNGVSDFIIYGANLTFMNWEDTNLYGLEFNKKKPALVYYAIQEVGEEGVVVVHPLPKSYGDEEDGRLVTVILPENQVSELKSELVKKGLM